MATIVIDVHVWSVREADEEVRRLSTLLSPDERARAQRFVARAHGDAFVVAHGRMREFLAGYTGQSAAELRFGSGQAGKPQLEPTAGAPHFNLSHSGDRVALAVAPMHAVGIDIQEVGVVRDGVAERFFTAAEARALAEMEPEDRQINFFRCWTRKEAFVKATGDGLNFPLKAFEVSVGAAPPVVRWIENGDARGVACWRILDFEPATGMVGAVAVKADAPEDQIAIRRMPPAGG